MKKKIKTLFFLLFFSLCFLGCSEKEKEIIQENKGTEIVEDISREMVVAVNVDKIFSELPFTSVLMNRSQFWGSLVFQGLLIPSDNIHNVQPDLCEEYSVSPDGKTYVFILKEDLYWHDGERLTTEDVVWSIETCVKNQEVNGFIKKGLQSIVGAQKYEEGIIERIIGMEATESDITIKLEYVDSNFLAALAQVPILPKHCFKESNREAIGQSDFWKMPIGSGPYQVVENIDNKEAVLVINELYSGKKPKIQQIRYKVLQDPENDPFDFTITSDPEVVSKFEERQDYEVCRTNNLYYRYLTMNVDGRNEHNPGIFNDKKVRQALSLGLDRKKIVENVYGSVALVIDSGIPANDSWYMQKEAETVEYNPQKAKELLREAGFDFERSLVLTRYHEDELSVKLLEEVAECWRNLGIKVDIQPIKNSEAEKLWTDTDWYDVALKNLAAVDYSEWYYEYFSGNQMWSTILQNRTEFDVLVSALSNTKWAYEREMIYEGIQMLEVEYTYKIPLAIIPQYVIYNKNRLYIPEIEFANLWYYYDLELSQWELNTQK
ncbi:MAG: ABC transporter substrate-binding protein [Lachnospiraceae bacterium]|nr:ABC transporter substrate-binding protein [Lachnospiraceae bacterium]